MKVSGLFLTHGKQTTQYSSDRRLGGPQGQFVHRGGGGEFGQTYMEYNFMHYLHHTH